MSSAVDNAHYIILPGATALAVAAVTTASQSLNLSTRTELGHLEGGRFLSIIVEQDTWVNFSVATGTASATAVTGATQTWLIPARTRLDGVPVNSKTWINFIGASAGYIRFYVATRNPQATDG